MIINWFLWFSSSTVKYFAGWTNGTAWQWTTSELWRIRPKRSWTSSGKPAKWGVCVPIPTKSFHRHSSVSFEWIVAIRMDAFMHKMFFDATWSRPTSATTTNLSLSHHCVVIANITSNPMDKQKCITKEKKI